MRKIPSAMSIAPMTIVRAIAPDSGSAMMSKPTTMKRIPSRPCSSRHQIPAFDMKTPMMLAMPAMTSSQPTMIVVTRVASTALYSAARPRMNSTTPSAMNQPRPLPASVSGGDAMVMLQLTSSVLPQPAARAAAASEYAPRARRDSTPATPGSPRRFMRMGRRRIWTLGRMLAGNSRIESAALGIRAHCHAAAVATAMAAHRPSCRAPLRQGRQVPGSARPGRYASGFPRRHDHSLPS